MQEDYPFRSVNFTLERFPNDCRNYNNSFDLTANSILTVNYHEGDTKTFFELKSFDIDYIPEVQQLSVSDKIINDQDELVDILDACILYCTGSSVRYTFEKKARELKINDNYEEFYNKYIESIGQQPIHRVTLEGAFCISLTAKTKVLHIERAIKYSIKCIHNPAHRDMMSLFRASMLISEDRFFYLYKIFEILRDEIKIIVRKTPIKGAPNVNVDFLQTFPQLDRHYKTDTESHIKKKYPNEYASKKEALKTYLSNIKPLIDFYFENY